MNCSLLMPSTAGWRSNRDVALTHAASCLCLSQVKPRLDLPTKPLQHMPAAIGQAIVLSERTGYGILQVRYYITHSTFRQHTVHFCLSDGRVWFFAVLKKDADGKRTCYNSVGLELDPDEIQMQSEESQQLVREVVELLLKWVSIHNIKNSE